MSNKGDQLRGELLLSSHHLLSGGIKVNCQEYRFTQRLLPFRVSRDAGKEGNSCIWLRS